MRTPAIPPTNNQDVLIVNQLVHESDWICDFERTLCHVCTRNFNTFRRKHHCRMCGEVVCRNCTLYKNVNIIATGVTKVRVCLSCIIMVTSAQKMESPMATAESSPDDASRHWLSTHLQSPAAKSETEYLDYGFNDNQLDYELDYSWGNPWPRAPIPVNEDERIRVLHSLNILDTPTTPVYSNICDLASKRLNCPMAGVSFLDTDRQWFKASIGLAQPSLPRNVAFCAHTIVSKDPVVSLDTTKDIRFCQNPLVTGKAAIRFYASAPICESRSGQVIGTVFVLDTSPRETCDASILERLGNVAMEHLIVKDNKITTRRSSGSDITRTTRGSSCSTDTAQNMMVSVPQAANTTELVANSSSNLENLLMNLLSQTTLTQQQLATQQISMSQTIGVHSEQIEKLTFDLARMEARIDAQMSTRGTVA